MPPVSRILELGSGTGLLGMVVSKLGNPKCVILTDGDGEAVGLLEKNLSSPNNRIDQQTIKAKFLRWGEDRQMEDFSTWCHLSWPDAFPIAAEFDHIIAGDVMYKEELPPIFFATSFKFLKHDGVLWLCHIPRANVGHELVVACAEKFGFRFDHVPTSHIAIENIPIEDIERAKVYRLTKIGSNVRLG